MNTYKIKITETYSGIFEIEANSEKEALEIFEKEERNGNIDLAKLEMENSGIKVVGMVDGMDETISEYYLANYPDDVLGKNINNKVTFRFLWECLENGMEIYNVIGVGDSIVRERLFEGLAEKMNVNYSVVYDMWLGGE